MPRRKPAFVVRASPTHGRGVFASRTLRKGMRIVEYKGTRSTYEEACARPDSDPNDPFHTLLFELSDGTVIDAGRRGNSARFINHGCSPNCEPIEHPGLRVFIHARRTIRAGEELCYDYHLIYPGRPSRRAREAMACRCGSPRCRGTMLQAPKPRRRA